MGRVSRPSTRIFGRIEKSKADVTPVSTTKVACSSVSEVQNIASCIVVRRILGFFESRMLSVGGGGKEFWPMPFTC